MPVRQLDHPPGLLEIPEQKCRKYLTDTPCMSGSNHFHGLLLQEISFLFAGTDDGEVGSLVEESSPSVHHLNEILNVPGHQTISIGRVLQNAFSLRA